MFNLTRYFSTVSFVLIAAAAGFLTAYYSHVTREQLVRHERSRAEDLTQVFENSLWREFEPLLAEPVQQAPEALRQRIGDARLREAMASMMRGTNVIKVKIYNPAGITVFSTDPKQIGESKANNEGFRSAAAGVSIGELTHRNQFDAFEGTLEDRDVIATYVPIHGVRDGVEGVAGVFEVYEDVTSFVQAANDRVKWVSTSVMLVLAGLYLAQFWVVFRAQKFLKAQEQALEQANTELDTRVRERTLDLQNEIVERRLAEDRLDFLAYHDPLTGLPNRLQFKEHLTEHLSRLDVTHSKLAVLFLDLDRFKDVNDTLGHSVGDALLIAVSQRLQTKVRTTDLLSRLGGDEFIFVLNGIANAEEAAVVAREVLGLFVEPFDVVDKHFYLSASIGASLAPDDGADVDILVRNADAAMYESKAQGRNRCHFYTPEMTASAQERIYMEALLRAAISRGELAVHFQPKVDTLTQKLKGAEALLRWNSAELGAVSPVRFIPLAEENGMVVDLGAWVLRETCKQIAAWDAEGFVVPSVSINLSVKQLERGNFPALLREVLTETGVAPPRIEFEITESVILAVKDAFAMLDDLRATGVYLSVDDFGTGYSSLSYLKNLPVQTLKIDRSFIEGIGQSGSDEAIITAIVALSHSLGLSTVAEGVETQEQAAFLRAQACGQIQGFLYGRPVSATAFLQQWNQIV